jgi:hypothetical protein
MYRLGVEDAVLNQFDPITRQAVLEFPAALTAVREQQWMGRLSSRCVMGARAVV